MKEKYAFVMMIKDKYWREFYNLNREGRKELSYVQHGDRAPPKNAAVLLFYVTKPVGEIAGYAEFIERKFGNADSLWNDHGNESAFKSKGQFEAFIGDEKKVSLIRFKNLQEAAKPIHLNNLLMILGKERLPRRGFYLNKETTDKLLALMV
jgi:predicted transcriptional regulator